MLLDIDAATHTFAHRCQTCNLERSGLHIDPAKGDLTLHRAEGVVVNLGVHCPACQTLELLRLAIAPHEAGEGRHADSLVGMRFADTGGIVAEHNVDGSDHPHHREQARHILALARHPRIAPHLKTGA